MKTTNNAHQALTVVPVVPLLMLQMKLIIAVGACVSIPLEYYKIC